ncbi:MAG: leucyl aminopeptidase [Chloroflexi bacterium]|nr:leucyl aminopeptidase [Chloroflexota bacterium]
MYINFKFRSNFLNIQAQSSDPFATRSDLLVLMLSKRDKKVKISPLTKKIDKVLDGLIASLISNSDITGDEGEMSLIYTPNLSEKNFYPKKIMILGLGDINLLSTNKVRKISASLIKKIKSLKVKKVHLLNENSILYKKVNREKFCQSFTEGLILGNYNFNKYKEKNSSGSVEKFTFLDLDNENKKIINRYIKVGSIYANAEILARDLVNEPGNMLSPSDLAQVAVKISEKHGCKIRVLDYKDVKKLGMGAFIGVAKGSERPLKFIHMSFEGDKGSPENNIWLIGKGITFDSGGISLKPGFGMGKMKGDMGGGAAVIAAMEAISQLKPKINVNVVCAATDNMPSGNAQMPGDIVKAYNGLTIEVDNTDAEGRLTLADAIGYAKDKGASKILDIATLTGAARIAMGDGVSPIFGNDENLINTVINAGNITGEMIWQLPLDNVTKKQNFSMVADIKNTGGRGGGSTTAAHFISKFAEGVSWAHIDIAATSMLDTDRDWYVAGATGVPTRTLIEFCINL